MNLPINLKIPDYFFKEEEKCGQQISIKEKKIWAIELDLLNEFKRVCDKYHLQWFIAYGSLIGVIRHKGFIPWDNDVDILMPRSDFNKLCEVAPAEFTGIYFWQTPVTEQGRYFQDFAKLRNSETTCYSEDLMLQGINCGIYIDIFVLDDVPDDEKKVNKLIHDANFYIRFARFLSPYPFSGHGMKRIKCQIIKIIHKVFFHQCNGSDIYIKINKIFSSTQGKGYHRVAYMGDPRRFDKTLFSRVIWMPFEMITVPVPTGYDKILQLQYGDYMQFPPLKERITHSYFEFDPECSYKDYLKE